MSPHRMLASFAASFLLSACGAEERTTVDPDDAAAGSVADATAPPVGDSAQVPNFDARAPDAAPLGPRLEVCPPEEPALGALCVEGLTCDYRFWCCCADYVPQTRCTCVEGRFVCGDSGECDPLPACADASPFCPPGMDAARPPPPPPPPPAVSPLAADAAVWRRFPSEIGALARAGLPRDSTGLIGRNREWGALYAPRFQLGTGYALRIAAVRDLNVDAGLALGGIRAGLAEVGDDGYLPERLPEAQFPGVVLSPADVASGGAFFLGDACLGLQALVTHPRADELTAADARADAVERAVRAARWLATQADLLRAADIEAPNRLFFDALAFQACGLLADDPALTALGEDFAARAYALFDPAGYFVEGGGHDTSYQAVAIVQAVNFQLAGGADPEGARAQVLQTGARWLAERIDAAGRLDSTGNTRTCEGGESFLGEPKLVSLPSVFTALAYVGVPPDEPALLGAAERLSAWVQAHPDGDPCHPE